LIDARKQHSGEICGLRWSDDQSYLVSGGNDNKVNIYNANKLAKYEIQLNYHSAAVKAIKFWNSRRGVIVTGGGINDHHLRFYNIIQN